MPLLGVRDVRIVIAVGRIAIVLLQCVVVVCPLTFYGARGPADKKCSCSTVDYYFRALIEKSLP